MGIFCLFVLLSSHLIDDFHQPRSSEGVTSTSRPQLQRDGWIRTLRRFAGKGCKRPMVITQRH